MRDAFISGLTDLALANPQIMLITGDLGFKVLDDFRLRCPKQYLNAGISEQNMSGIACGLALEGWTVFTYSIGNFVSLRCLEQLRNGASYHGLNVNPVSIGAGFTYGELGATHHATEDISIMRSLPEFDVLCPGDDLEARSLASHIELRDNPSYLRLETKPYTFPSDTENFSFGKARTLKPGTDLALLSTGGISRLALEASEILESRGIKARVVHHHSVVPLDTASILNCASQIGHIITIEEHSVVGGFGSAIAETILDNGVQIESFTRLGIKTGFSKKIGSQNYLRAAHGLSIDGIVQSALDVLSSRQVEQKSANQKY